MILLTPWIIDPVFKTCRRKVLETNLPICFVRQCANTSWINNLSAMTFKTEEEAKNDADLYLKQRGFKMISEEQYQKIVCLK